MSELVMADKIAKQSSSIMLCSLWVDVSVTALQEAAKLEAVGNR